MTMRIWNGTNGSWSVARNWHPGGVPGRGDVADITAGIVNINGVDTSYRTIVVDAVRGDIATGITVQNTSLGAGSNTQLIGAGNVAFITLKNAVTDGIIGAYNGPGEIIVPGATTAVNRGWWPIASTTGSSLTLIANGNFVNAGAIESGSHGSFAMAMTQDEVNYGLYQVDPGGAMSFSSGNNTPTTYNSLINVGNITVNGGTMYVGANIAQPDSGKITITNNGNLTLTGTTTGGTIQINSGMLNFAPTQFAPGPIGASNLGTPIAFTGDSGEIDLGEAILSATFRPDTNDLLVAVPWKGGQLYAADFHLSGAYSASNFTVDAAKGAIMYHHTA
jgi:hypothetical protein